MEVLEILFATEASPSSKLATVMILMGYCDVQNDPVGVAGAELFDVETRFGGAPEPCAKLSSIWRS